jgi:integrase
LKAAELATEMAHLRRTTDLGALLHRAVPLRELLESWIEHHVLKTRSGPGVAGTIRKHLVGSLLGDVPLGQLTASRIEVYLHEKDEELSAQSVNHLRGHLSRALNWGRRMGKWSGPNPVADTKKRKLPKKVPDYLRPEEVGPVLAALPDRWRSLFATAIYTGMRKGELLGLRKSDVDLERRLVTVARSYDRETTKGGHADVLPIAAELIPYLEAAIESSPSDLVFPKPDGTMACETLSLEIVPRRAFRRAGIVASYRHSCRRQGCGHREGAPDATLRRCPKCNMKLWPHGLVRPIRFHHLRHTTASLLMMAGANPAAVQRIMRHTDPRLTTEVYGHLAPGYLRSEIDRLQLAPPPPESPRVAVAIETTPASATAPGLAADLLQTGPFQASGGSEVIAQALVVATKIGALAIVSLGADDHRRTPLDRGLVRERERYDDHVAEAQCHRDSIHKVVDVILGIAPGLAERGFRSARRRPDQLAIGVPLRDEIDEILDLRDTFGRQATDLLEELIVRGAHRLRVYQPRATNLPQGRKARGDRVFKLLVSARHRPR